MLVPEWYKLPQTNLSTLAYYPGLGGTTICMETCPLLFLVTQYIHTKWLFLTKNAQVLPCRPCKWNTFPGTHIYVSFAVYISHKFIQITQGPRYSMYKWPNTTIPSKIALKNIPLFDMFYTTFANNQRVYDAWKVCVYTQASKWHHLLVPSTSTRWGRSRGGATTVQNTAQHALRCLHTHTHFQHEPTLGNTSIYMREDVAYTGDTQLVEGRRVETENRRGKKKRNGRPLGAPVRRTSLIYIRGGRRWTPLHATYLGLDGKHNDRAGKKKESEKFFLKKIKKFDVMIVGG